MRPLRDARRDPGGCSTGSSTAEWTWDWDENAPILQPKLFREIFLPRYRQFCEFVKGRAPVKVALHSCGSVCWALDDLANAGIDIVQPG